MAPIISPIIIPEKQDKNLLILSQKTRQIIQLIIVNINVTGNENIMGPTYLTNHLTDHLSLSII